MSDDIVQGEGYAVGHIDQMGDAYGFRKIRRTLGVTAFGVNAIALPPGYETGAHFHEQQEELYFCHRGRIEIEFGDGSTHVLEPAAPPGSTHPRCAGSRTSAPRTPST